MIKLLDYLYLLRPTLFFPGITIYLYGARENETVALPALTATLLLLATIYLTNQLYDIETDSINGKLFFLPQKIISIKAAQIFNIIICIALTVLLLLTLDSFFPFIIVMIFIITNLFYNHPVFNWKGKPFLSAFSSFAGGTLGYLAGYYSQPHVFTNSSLIEALPYGICIMSGALMTMIPDMAGDERAQKKTTPIFIGKKRTMQLVLILNLINIVLATAVDAKEVGLVSFISFIMGLYYYSKQKFNDTNNIKVSILLLSLLICLSYPPYFLSIAVYFIVSRVYYRKRFNIKYP